MRLVVLRGQALLLLVVGGLAAAVVVGAGLEQSGVLSPVTAWTAEVVSPHRSQVPPRIEIGSRYPTPAYSQGPADAPTGPTSAIVEGRPSTAPGAGSGTAAVATQPSPVPTTTVVPATVYAYPPDDHGGSAGPGSGSGSGGSGSSGGGGAKHGAGDHS
jgi:hypothetical protein